MLGSRHTPKTTQVIRGLMTTKRPGPLSQYFYFFMSLLIAAVVIYGFSHTVDKNLIHASPIRPWILYLHAGVFSGWVVFFVVQSALVRVHKVRVHRTLGWFGVGIGALIPVLGISTAISMARFKTLQFHATDAAAFLIVPFLDVTCFTVAFALAIYWRRKPEFHRRLMLVATCALTAAAFGRFPAPLGEAWFYSGVDLLIFFGVLRDVIVTRRVHPVYRYALPALIFGQFIAMHLFLTASPRWLVIADAILR
jgi:hypothetical protein